MAEIDGKKVQLSLANFKSYKTERRIYKRTLVYHSSNSKKGFPIKGTNLRVSFEYIEEIKNKNLPPNACLNR